jgi:hypothetical protein
MFIWTTPSISDKIVVKSFKVKFCTMFRDKFYSITISNLGHLIKIYSTSLLLLRPLIDIHLYYLCPKE